MSFDVLVLAGRRGPNQDPVAAAGGASCKALVPVAGTPMIERVLATLQGSPHVGAITVAMDGNLPLAREAPALADALAKGRVQRRTPDHSPCATVRAAFAERAGARPLLIATADHPFLTREMVDAFCAGATLSGADVSAAVTPTRLLDAAFPGARRTRLRFRDDAYSGCNLFALMRPGADNVLAFWQRLEQERKRPWRMAMRIGSGTLLRYALGRLTLDAAVARLGRRVGAKLAAIRLYRAEAAKDVDSVSDLHLVEGILSEREAPPSPAD